MFKVDHLLGKQFKLGIQDCYTTVRDFYKDNFDLDIPNLARPNDFWNQGLNLYMDNFYEYGFRPVNEHPSKYRPGDGLLMAIKSPIANHAAVLLEDGRVLHHLYGGLSSIENYRSFFRDTTVAVIRHPKIAETPIESNSSNMDLMELLPDAVRQKVLNALSSAGTGEGGIHSPIGGGSGG